LETICLRCLRRNPSGRYGTARPLVRLIGDLRRFLGGQPISERKGKPWRRPVRWLRSQWRPLLIAALTLALVTGLAFWDAYRHRAAWDALARADAPPAEHASALRHFERFHADWPETSEAAAGLALARYRAGRVEEAEGLLERPGWQDDPSGWARTRILTLA